MNHAQEFRDPADSIHASYWPDMAEQIDKPEDLIIEAAASRDREALRRLLGEEIRSRVADGLSAAIMIVLSHLDQDDNAALGIQCCLYAINRNPRSEIEISRRFGVTRAAVSKRIVTFCERLHLPEARGMKSAKARKVYRRRQRNVARTRQKNNGGRHIPVAFTGGFNEQWN